MSKNRKSISSVNNKAHLILSFALMALGLSLFQHVQGWILFLLFCGVSMRTAFYFKWNRNLLSIRTLNLLAVLCALVLAYVGLQLGLLLAMINLLVMASALKLMLLRTNRDYFQLIATSLFLCACGLIFEQGIGLSFFYYATATAFLWSLATHVSPSLSIGSHAKTLMTLVAQALPIGAMLFLILPQIEPLWRMPTGKNTETGLSETVTPGDIANLSKSDDLAFRVTFENEVPEISQRYWRAIVLEKFDGKTWSIHPNRLKYRQRLQRSQKPNQIIPIGASLEYEIIAEPSNQQWLFSIDTARSDSRQIWQSHTYQLIKKQPLQSRFKYTVESYPESPLNNALKHFDIKLNQEFPTEHNPRTQDWVAKLRQKHPDNDTFIQAVLSYFRDDFSYTLEPELMTNNPVDQLLFDYKAGFCSHYASAFAYIMRLVGIPARMVTGYHGGVIGEAGYMSVRQYDAHAWTEVWLDDNGWQRVDPTAVVSPARIAYGIQQTSTYEELFKDDSVFGLSALDQLAWLSDLQKALEDVDYFWSRWVLGFDRTNQQDLFKSLLGEVTPKRLSYLSVSVILITALLLLLYNYKAWWPRNNNKALSDYLKAVNCLEKWQINRENWQGPQDLLKQVNSQCPPDIARQFEVITQLFVGIEYQRDLATREQLTRLRTQTKNLQALIRN
jgi:transglutaminase-like putative cysteine protease